MRILLFLVISLFVLFGYSQYLRRTSLFFPSKYPVGDWTAKADDEWLTTSDGVKLHGWYFRAADAHAPVLVWMHGNAGNVTGRAPVAAELARRGISVFVFDWRGYGRSEGEPSEDALYLDALAAVDFAQAHLGKDIVLYGESLGGPYAAYAATKRHARCVVIENSFPSLAALGNMLYKPIPVGLFAPGAMTTARWLNEARLPVLVLHSRADDVIPFPLGQRLFDELTVPKEMLVSQSAMHGEIPSVEGPRYYDAVVNFVAHHH